MYRCLSFAQKNWQVPCYTLKQTLAAKLMCSIADFQVAFDSILKQVLLQIFSNEKYFDLCENQCVGVIHFWHEDLFGLIQRQQLGNGLLKNFVKFLYKDKKQKQS